MFMNKPQCGINQFCIYDMKFPQIQIIHNSEKVNHHLSCLCMVWELNNQTNFVNTEKFGKTFFQGFCKKRLKLHALLRSLSMCSCMYACMYVCTYAFFISYHMDKLSDGYLFLYHVKLVILSPNRVYILIGWSHD